MLSALAAVGLLGDQVAHAKMPWANEKPIFAEQLAGSDAFVLVQWVSDKQDEAKQEGSREFTVKEVVRNSMGEFSVGQKISLRGHVAGNAGDLFVLIGTRADREQKIAWDRPRRVTDASFKYIVQTPAPDVPIGQQLDYYGTFLESSDPLIADDAFRAVVNAPFGALRQLSEKLPRQKVFQWLTSSNTPVTRIGLYGQMLGVCGNADDAKYLEEKVLEKTQEFPIGKDGLMCGYLMLTGEKGLATLDDAKLRNRDVSLYETYYAVIAVRFMWEHGQGKIEPERLLQSMRILLEHPHFADLAVSDLRRWKDWSAQERLMKLYDEEEFNNPTTKRAIARYMVACSKDLPKDADSKIPEHVEQARKYLETLRQKDPKAVSEAERFYILSRK